MVMAEVAAQRRVADTLAGVAGLFTVPFLAVAWIIFHKSCRLAVDGTDRVGAPGVSAFVVAENSGGCRGRVGGGMGSREIGGVGRGVVGGMSSREIGGVGRGVVGGVGCGVRGWGRSDQSADVADMRSSTA